jgi:hypothetical protein
MSATRISVLITVILTVTFIIPGSVRAFDGVINLQGSLLDAEGNPLEDGTYSLNFQLFTSAEGGSPLWSEQEVPVTTTGGLFSVNLGEQVPIPSQTLMTYDYDSVFLEIRVGEEVLQPRTRLVATPYSMVAGDLEGFSDDGGVVRIRTNSDQGSLDLMAPDESTDARLSTEAGGKLELNHNLGRGVVLTASTDFIGGGGLWMYDKDGNGPIIKLQASATGDETAQLPIDAVNSFEMLNEPGLSQGIVLGSVDVSATSGFEDVVLTTLTIPAEGYVVVVAEAGLWSVACADTLFLCGDGLWLRVTDTTLFTWPDQTTREVWLAQNEVQSNRNRLHTSVSVRHTYFKEAGTHTFRFQAWNVELPGSQILYDPVITAMYFPTSYGPVFSTSPQPGDNPEARQIERKMPRGQTAVGYEVDLRYYELRAKEAHLRALQAERDLQAARDRAEREED